MSKDIPMSEQQVNETDPGTIAALKEKAQHAFETTGKSVSDARHRAADELEANPLVVLAGGIAIGAIAGALLPRTAQEAKALGPLGKRLSAAAVAAATAARETGKEQLTTVLPDKEAARAAFGNVVQAATDQCVKAAKGDA